MPDRTVEAARVRVEPRRPERGVEHAVGRSHQVLVAQDDQILEVRSVADQRLVAHEPVLDELGVRAPRPLPGRARDGDRVAHHHDQPRSREDRLQEPAADQVRRRLLDEHRPRQVPVRAPVGGEARPALVADEGRLLGEVRAGIETEPAGAAVGPCRAGRRSGGAGPRPRGRRCRESRSRAGARPGSACRQRRAAAVQPADEHERVLCQSIGSSRRDQRLPAGLAAAAPSSAAARDRGRDHLAVGDGGRHHASAVSAR